MATRFDPRWPFIITGDGHIVQLRSKTERFNEEGVEGYEVIINPSQEVIAEYGFKKEDFNEDGFIIRWFQRSSFRTLRDDPVKGMYFLYKDLNGQETAFSRSIVEFTEMIESQQKHIRVLKARNASLWHELKIMTSQMKEYMSKNVEIIKLAKTLEGGMGGYGETEEPSTDMT